MLLLDTLSSRNLSISHHKWIAINGARMKIFRFVFPFFLKLFFCSCNVVVFFTIHKLNSQRWFGSNVHYAVFIVPQQSARTVLFAFVIRFSTQFLFSSFVVHFSRSGLFIAHSYSSLQLCTQFNTQHTHSIFNGINWAKF